MELTIRQQSIVNLLSSYYDNYKYNRKAELLGLTKTELAIQQSARDERTVDIYLPIGSGKYYALHTFVLDEALKCLDSDDKILYVLPDDIHKDFIEFSKDHNLDHNLILTSSRKLDKDFIDESIFKDVVLVVVGEPYVMKNSVVLDKLCKRNHPTCFYIQVG